MATILRVKRRNDEGPLDALVLACKRRKTTENDEAGMSAPSNSVKTIVKFAGTVTAPEENVVEHLIKTLGKDELQTNYKLHPIDILKKLREQKKHIAAENRYKVINCRRDLDTSNIENFEDQVMTLIDIEDTDAVQKDFSKEQDKSYVYDLYYAKTEHDVYVDDLVSVYTLDQELVFDTYRIGRDVSEEEHDTEDSNSESNWRNDYPDSDHSERSIDEDDMKEAVRNMRLDEGSDLSSEDDFVYAVDASDVDAYGFKYAVYKARMKEELKETDNETTENSDAAYMSEQECSRGESEDSDQSNLYD